MIKTKVILITLGCMSLIIGCEKEPNTMSLPPNVSLYDKPLELGGKVVAITKETMFCKVQESSIQKNYKYYKLQCGDLFGWITSGDEKFNGH